MRDHSAHIELTREEAVEQTVAALTRENYAGAAGYAPVKIAVAEAQGAILAEDVCALTDIPNALTCCMDSVAFKWADFAALEPGQVPDTSSWVRGEKWEFANTGIAMPEGFDCAIVIEHAQVSADEAHVTIDAAPSAQFAGTRPAGDQHKRGDVIAKAGTIVTPDVAAKIVGCGHGTVKVLRRPRVAFIPTGNELVPAGVPYAASAPQKYTAHGKVFESNSIVVRARVEAWGGVFVPFDIVPDEPEAIRAAVAEAADVADIVVLNAGSSKGSDDWSVEVIDDMGQIICHQTSHGPGHHSSMAVVKNTRGAAVPVVGISGPAGGASSTLNFYLLPMMRNYFGRPAEKPKMKAVLKTKEEGHRPPMHKGPGGAVRGEERPHEKRDPGRKFYGIRPVRLCIGDDGVLEAHMVDGRPGSAEAATANGIYMALGGPGGGGAQVGDVIEVELREPSL